MIRWLLIADAALWAALWAAGAVRWTAPFAVLLSVVVFLVILELR